MPQERYGPRYQNYLGLGPGIKTTWAWGHALKPGMVAKDQKLASNRWVLFLALWRMLIQARESPQKGSEAPIVLPGHSKGQPDVLSDL